MTIECDILVIGGGPAGSSAARAASRRGMETIVIDKKEEIGTPVQCAEGVGKFLFPYLPFRIPDKYLIWKMDGMVFWTDDISLQKTGNFWKSYSIDRKKFDKWISELAINDGAKVFTNTELIDIEINDDALIRKAIVENKEKTVEINPKVVIAADGVESTVLKLLNLYNPKKGDIADVYSWEMKNIDLYNPTFEQVFTGEFTPSGYAYIFPNGKHSANFGVGGIYAEKKIEYYFEEFLEIPIVKKQIKNAEYVTEKSGKALWNDLTDKWIYGNVILTGDVANQNLKPFIEGILPSIICGDIAGNISTDMVNGKNIDDSTYRKYVEEKMGEHFNISNELLKIINSLYAKKEKTKYLQFFALITELMNQENFNDFNLIEYDDLKLKISRMINEL
jgi:digeranylgeranylglycerophospholipid reductase